MLGVRVCRSCGPELRPRSRSAHPVHAPFANGRYAPHIRPVNGRKPWLFAGGSLFAVRVQRAGRLMVYPGTRTLRDAESVGTATVSRKPARPSAVPGTSGTTTMIVSPSVVCACSLTPGCPAPRGTVSVTCSITALKIGQSRARVEGCNVILDVRLAVSSMGALLLLHTRPPRATWQGSWCSVFNIMIMPEPIGRAQAASMSL